MQHHLPLVVKKTDESLGAVKEALSFFKKRMEIEEEYSKSLQKLYRNTASQTLKKKLTRDSTLSDKEIGWGCSRCF
jgi:hypothetical protein